MLGYQLKVQPSWQLTEWYSTSWCGPGGRAMAWAVKSPIVEAKAAFGVEKASWAVLVSCRVGGLVVVGGIGDEGLDGVLPADILPHGQSREVVFSRLGCSGQGQQKGSRHRAVVSVGAAIRFPIVEQFAESREHVPLDARCRLLVDGDGAQKEAHWCFQHRSGIAIPPGKRFIDHTPEELQHCVARCSRTSR